MLGKYISTIPDADVVKCYIYIVVIRIVQFISQFGGVTGSGGFVVKCLGFSLGHFSQVSLFKLFHSSLLYILCVSLI